MSSANSDNLFLLFHFGFLLFLFLLWLLWLKLPKLCWITVVRVGNLVLFLILVEMVSVFHAWEWCGCGFVIYALYYVEVSSLYGYFLKGFYHEWVLNFVESFFCICWNDHMVFILQLINMRYHIDWFAYTEESLHSWDKLHFIMVYDPFNVLLDSVCENFVEDFCIYVHQWYWPVVFFVCDIFVWFCIWVIGASENEFGSVPPSAIFWKSLRRTGFSSSLNVWRTHLWSHLVLGFCLLEVF